MSDTRIISLGDYTPAREFRVATFPAPFAVVNAAVYHAIDIGMAEQGRRPYRDDTPGATSYHLRFVTGDIAFLYVLQRGDAITTIQVHPCFRRGDRPAWRPETLDIIGDLIGDCIQEVTNAIRYTQPDFGLFPIEGLPEPMPRYDVHGWAAVFTWVAKYASAMPDAELARLQGVSEQTVHNMRSKLGATRRPARGRSAKKKAEQN